MKVSSVLTDKIQILQEAGIDSAQIDAEVIISHVLSCQRHNLYLDSDKEVSKEDLHIISELILRRSLFEPVAYICGNCEFYSLEFNIKPGVLIPRPETELLVDLALYHAPLNGNVLDIGTGSGALAVSIAYNRPDLTITATDISSEALEIAQENEKKLAANSNISFKQGNLFEPVGEVFFDLIVSNPPYVDRSMESQLQKDLAYEPEIALYSTEDGLFHLKEIISGAKSYCKPHSVILLEIGYDQKDKITEIAKMYGFTCSVLNDYAGHARIAVLKYE